VLDEFAHELPASGTAVDVAGGAGRNALWLAGQGYDTTLIDISSNGLRQAGQAASQRGVSLTLVERDLEADGMPAGQWDVAVVCLFVYRPVLKALPASLAPGGVLIFEHPTMTNLEVSPKPSASFLLDNGEVLALAKEMQDVDIVHVSEAWRSHGRHLARLVVRKHVVVP